MHTLLKIQHFFENIYYTILSILRVLLRFRFNSDLNQFKKEREDIFILANGPSLKKSLEKDVEFLKAKDCFCVNLFAISDAFQTIRPKSYILLDIGMFIDNALPLVKENNEKLLSALIQKTSWEMDLFVPYEAKCSRLISELVNGNPNIRIRFFNRTVIYGSRRISHFLYRHNLGMPPPQNVLIGSIMLAMAMHYKRIYILGADHSWHETLLVDENNQLTINDVHFDDAARSNKRRTYHDQESHKKLTVHEFLYQLARSFRSYHMIRDYAEYKGKEIINASEKSFIDAFEKKTMNEIIEDL